MKLQKIYNPIQRELNKVDRILKDAFSRAKNDSILKVTDYILESPGKRLRPALVILSAKATASNHPPFNQLPFNHLTKIAAAIELIHSASLIHDDVIDHASIRHNKPTVNYKWGSDVSISLGDYLYSEAFRIVSECEDLDIIRCISAATKTMCEGELIQVCERDNLELLKERYFLIVKKKTATLFAASCQAGGLISNSKRPILAALKGYGLNFGIAFQIIDDYLDLVSSKNSLGKLPGQDLTVGEITLPLLNLFESLNIDARRELHKLLRSGNKTDLKEIKKRLLNSDALYRTRETTLFYLNSAKQNLKILPDSDYRKSLFDLADFIFKKAF